MDLDASLKELSNRVRTHREVLATEEAAKNALIMPFLKALGYDVFNPSEVVPEFVCDVGTKKGEKVDYAICANDEVRILVECKPATAELTIKNASQLFRYFSVTNARLAILTNGVVYKFFSDIDMPNKMDDKPFYTLDLEAVRKQDLRILADYTKPSFDVDKIVRAASTLKTQTLVYKSLREEFENPSDDFTRLIASKVSPGRLTAQVVNHFKQLIGNSINSLIGDMVRDRLETAISGQQSVDDLDNVESDSETDSIETTQVEIDGFNIVKAIGSQLVDPSRIVMRDAKSYCAILLDDNNRKAIARMHFNSDNVRYFGTFIDKQETKHTVEGPVGIYKFKNEILEKIKELEN